MTNTDHLEVCTVITAITGNTAWVGTDHGNWDGDHFVGFACRVELPGGGLLYVPGKTHLEAACEALALVRGKFPELAAKASGTAKCAKGMDLYVAYVEAKTDAALAASAAMLADMRSAPVMEAAE